MPIVYILKLKNSKRYVGYTNNYKKRMEKHFSGKGSQVTRKYPPVKVERIIPCYNKTYGLIVERNVTQQLMQKHGVNMVRGAVGLIPRTLTQSQSIKKLKKIEFFI